MTQWASGASKAFGTATEQVERASRTVAPRAAQAAETAVDDAVGTVQAAGQVASTAARGADGAAND